MIYLKYSEGRKRNTLLRYNQSECRRHDLLFDESANYLLEKERF